MSLSSETAAQVQVAILQTVDIPPLPPDIKVLLNWGDTRIILGDGSIVDGDHVLVEGTADAIRAWLGTSDVWVTKGAPVMQEFEMMRIRP